MTVQYKLKFSLNLIIYIRLITYTLCYSFLTANFRQTIAGHLSGTSTIGWLLTLPTNIRQGKKVLQGTNPLAYSASS